MLATSGIVASAFLFSTIYRLPYIKARETSLEACIQKHVSMSHTFLEQKMACFLFQGPTSWQRTFRGGVDEPALF